MMNRLVELALKIPLVVVMLVLALVVGGGMAYKNLDVEAYPNPVPPMIEVIVQPNGLSAEEVEKYVTVPAEIGLAGMPGLEHTRSQSLFGLADIKCYFAWGTKYEDARQEVINRLQFVTLPPGVTASLSPWNAIGEVFRYTLEGKNYSLLELKTAEDWILERQWKQVPGVVDVVSFGGETKQFQVSVDPVRLRSQNITLVQLLGVLASANQSVGGQRLTLGEQSYDVRGVGLLGGSDDIKNVVVAEHGGVPVRIGDVASVNVGPAPRLGMVGKDDQSDVVQGTVLMRYGGETPSTLAGIHERLRLIRDQHLLPPGMEIRPYYDRGELVGLTMHTVTENLAVGMVLVSIVLLLFLGNGRAAVITSLVIPLALLAAFCGLVLSSTSANLISLGAIDFGIVVDSAVIMTEAIFHKLGPHETGTPTERVIRAAKEVAGPMAFSTLIIGVSFLPLFTMTGVSGVIFAPMAKTYAFAIGGAIILALTMVPVLMGRLIKIGTKEGHGFAMRGAEAFYRPIFNLATSRPKLALVLVAIPVLLSFGLAPHIGREFMPKLEEGNLWIRATLPISISREQASGYADRMRAIVRGCPVVAPSKDAQGKDLTPTPHQPCDEKTRRHQVVLSAVSQVGRPDDGTDVTGYYNIEIFAPLMRFDEWPKGLSKEILVSELHKEMEEYFPGVTFDFSQMISDNVDEAVAGVKGQNSVKVFGPDLNTNEKNAESIQNTLEKIPGAAEVAFMKSSGQPSLKISPDRQLCARYGLNTGDVLSYVQAAIGGQSATRVFEGDRSFDVMVRLKEKFRDSLDAVRAVTVTAPSGVLVPLGQLAKIELVDGPSTIFREDGERYTPVKFSVRGRDLASTVETAQNTVKNDLHFPYGTHLKWTGELDELRRAQERLGTVIPLTLALVAFLVYAAVRTGKDTLVVLLNIPVACAGGLFALLLTGTNLSVSAAMGFVSVFGIAVQDAILVVTYFQRLKADGLDVRQAAREAVEMRLRPVLMTALVAILGLTPAALATGIGSQTQRPLALVVIGGAILLLLVTRLLQPALLILLHSRDASTSPKDALLPGAPIHGAHT